MSQAAADLDAAFESVRELLEFSSEAWRPEPGQTVLGVLRLVSRRDTANSENYPVLTIAPADGSGWVDVHAFHQVLWQEFDRQEPQVGDVVGIRYLGPQQGKAGGKPYEGYRLAVVKMAARPSGAERIGAPISSPQAPDADEPGPEGAAPPPPTLEDRTAAWGRLVAVCGEVGLSVSGALNTACGARYTNSSAPSATIEEIARTLDWIKERRP